MIPDTRGFPTWQKWAEQVVRILNAFMGRVEGSFVRQRQIVYLRSFTVAALPSAAEPGGVIYVSDEAGGAVMAFSDGTNWRRVTDRVVVS